MLPSAAALLDCLFEQPAVYGEAIRDPLQFVSYRVAFTDSLLERSLFGLSCLFG